MIASISSVGGILHEFKRGISGISAICYDTDGQPDWATMTREEYTAMKWLKRNTIYSAIIVSDRWYSDPQAKYSRFFYYSTFSGRQNFLESWDYSEATVKKMIIPQKIEVVTQLYSQNFSKKSRIMQDNHIDYLVLSKFIHPNSSIFDKEMDKVFENRDIKIYKPK